MASLQTRIQDAAARNETLLRGLAETDHAPPSLTQQKRLVADLEAELASSDKRVADLAKRRGKELKDHEKYRDSIVRRFAFRAACKSEKFAERAEKEEKEYFEALQDEQKEQAVNRSIKEQLQQARQVAGDLETQVARHTQLQRDLDELYASIFSGPTPEVPEEDDKERIMADARRAYDDTKSRAETEYQAMRLLGDAQRRMNTAMGQMEEALAASRYDMFGGGTFADMMERSALQRADNAVASANMAVQQAQRLNPSVGQMPPVNINHGHLMRDVVFDNIFTDMAFHEEIKASTARVQRAAGVVQRMAADAAARHKELDAEYRRREEALQNARIALQKVRENAFETFAGKPEYSES